MTVTSQETPPRQRLRVTVGADWRANRNPRVRLILVLYRAANASRTRPWALPVVAVYKLVSEWGFGMEIPASTRIGAGLKIEHGYGLVIHAGAVLGAGCVLKHGVTIGMNGPGGAPTLGDGVVVGPGAQILGCITVGDGARVGAGAIVRHDVPPGCTAVGNPARVLP